MNILIVGYGSVGSSLAEHFSTLGHHITVIDHNENVCEQVAGKMDGFVVSGIGSDPAILEKAGIGSADMVITVTPSDEINLLICNFAMQRGVEKRIARVKSDVYTGKKFGVDLEKTGVTNVIEPEWGVVDKVLQYVELPDVLETANFQSGDIYLRGYRVTENMPIAGKSLAEIRVMAGAAHILFVVIVREGKSLSPTGEQKLIPGDEFVAVMPRDSFDVFRAFIDHKDSKMKKIVISGDSLTAIHLGTALKPLAEQIILVDPDDEHAHTAAETLNGVDVYNGTCTDSEMLREINIRNADCFIAAGNDSEDNIMSCLLAKAEGAGMVIAVRDTERYGRLFASLGIDHIINPREITLNTIIENIQAVPIGPYLKLRTADIAITRLKVGENSPAAGKSLDKLSKLNKKSIMVGCIIRDGSVIIPDGKATIEKGDTLMLLCERKHIKWVNRLFHPETPPAGDLTQAA